MKYHPLESSVLLFLFALVLFGYKPIANSPIFSFDKNFYVPTVTLPILAYQIIGVIVTAASLFLIITAFRKAWADKIDTVVNNRTYLLYPLFLVFWLVYTITFFDAVAVVVSDSPPAWIVYLVFYSGFLLFLLIPIISFKE